MQLYVKCTFSFLLIQVFHICADGRKISFLCPNGTIFRQSHLICDWWWTVDCANSKEHYEESAELLANDRKIYQARSDAISKSRARQQVNRKPGIIRESEGESASEKSYITEPVPRNARVQTHSRVISPRKQLPNSTPNPGLSRSSEEFQTVSRMEQAGQRQIHAFNPSYTESNQKRPQYQENRQSKLFDKTDQHHKDINSQNTPPVPRGPEQGRILQSNQFPEFQPPLESPPRPQQTPVTTHRPKTGQFKHSRQFEQSLSDRHVPVNRVSQSRQQPQQSVILQGQQQPQFRPEPQTFSENKVVNNDSRSYNHVRFLPATEIEGQLPAETGSFVNSRGSKLNGINQARDRQRILQNRVQQTTSTTYVDFDRSRNITLEISSQVKSAGVQVTERGITDLPNKQSSPEPMTEEVHFDDVGLKKPSSEEQFKDEDLFYLRGTSTENDLIDGIAFTESPVKHSNTYTSVFEEDFKNGSVALGPTGNVALFNPPSDTRFGNEYVRGGYENEDVRGYTESTESVHILDTLASTTLLPDVDYGSGSTSPDLPSSFPTRKSHRFYSPTTTQTPNFPEPSTVQNTENSTEEPPEEDVFTRKNTSNPHTVISYRNDKDHPTESPPELLRNIDISTVHPMRSQPTSTPASLLTVPNKLFSAVEESVPKKLEPIFVEIIDQGSSERPVLRAYTVEELENRRENTGSVKFTDKNKLLTSNPEAIASRSNTLQAGERSSTVTESPSPFALSRMLRPPNELTYLTAFPDHKYSELPTTELPPNPYYTLSTILLPPEHVAVSSDLHDKNKVSNGGSHQDSSTFRTTIKSAHIDHTTPRNHVTLSRRLQPPFESLVQFNSGLSVPNISSTVQQGKQQHTIIPVNQDTFTGFETFEAGGGQNIGTYQLRQEADLAQGIFVTSELSSSATSTSEPTGPSSVHVDVQHLTSEPSPVTPFPFKKHKTVSESIQSTTPFLNISLEEPATEPDIPISHLKQEPSSFPWYKSRDGFVIPASSGPSTLHSLAVYFSIRDRTQETTVDTLNGFSFEKLKLDGEKPTTESVPTVLSTANDITPDVNETDVPVLAPSLLTKPIRDSYSLLFPNNKEVHSSVAEQMRNVTSTAEIPDAITKGKKTSSLHNAIMNELLDKLAEISEMEAKPLSDRKIASSQRQVLHSDTEDLLQGTDSQDLRELAQIFSRALSAYLENPEGFKKVLSEVRPKVPSYVDRDGAKEFESKEFLDTTRSTVISSTPVPLTTSSTEYSSVTQEDEEVLDFSDMSKVSRRKSKPTTLLPPHSKSIKTEKWKNSVSTSYVNPAVVTSSGRNRVTHTTSKPSSSDTVEDVYLKPPEEGLQNAQSTYYTLSQQQVPENTATVSPNMFESLQVTEGLGEDYTLPFGTKQYDGPGYGPQAGEVKFGPTAGGVNDPSRPRYGGFQNNSGVTLKEAPVTIIDTQARVDATTLVPEGKLKARSTVKPISVTLAVETTSTEEVPAEIGSIFNTFIPQELNNLAVAGTPETPAALISDENILKQRDNPQNLVPSSNEAVLGVNIGSYASLPSNRPSNSHNVEEKWSSLGSTVDALTINHELSESDIKQRASSAAAQQFISSITTTQELTPTTHPVFRVRNRITSKSDTSELAVPIEYSENKTRSLPYNCGTFTSGRSSVSPQTETNKHSQLAHESVFTSTSESSSEHSDTVREIKPFNISDRTFYSEEIKSPPPPSASLVRVSASRKSKVETSNSSSKVPESSETKSIITSDKSTPFIVQQTTTTQTYYPTHESENISFQRKSGTDRYSQHVRKFQEPDELRQGLRGASEISVPSERFVPAPFTETSPTADTVITSWKKENNHSEQEVSNVDLLPVQSFTSVPVSASISPLIRNIPTRRTKYTTTNTHPNNERFIIKVLEEDHFVVPNTSASARALLDGSSSVIATSGSNTLSRKKEPSEKLKPLNKELITGEPNNASNSQRFVRINTVVNSTSSQTSPNTSTDPAVRKTFLSNQSPTSILRTRSGTDVRIDDVTSNQLQALEDLQSMLFSANTTATKDGTMFANLNESSTLTLISTMKQAVMNSTVRRLVLLLVNSLKENTPQETRTQLIEALLRMPINHKLSDTQQDSVSTLLEKRVEHVSEKLNGESTLVTVTPLSILPETSPISTITQPDLHDKHLSITQVSATNLQSRAGKNSQTATSEAPQVRTAARSKGRRLVRVKITTERPLVMPRTTSSSDKHSQPKDFTKEGDSLPQSDTRAVELLQSLYSLASRWG